MGVISSNSFDPVRRYASVRLQQGVPLVDADWNEMEDIHKFELRTFLKWFVGDGVPNDSDAFRIGATGDPPDPNDPDDFIILAGVVGTLPANIGNLDKALFFTGSYLVEGLEATIASDVKFKSQPLHESQPTANALATAWNVPKITGLSLPTPPNTVVLVYLDVWERLVTPTEDPSLILAGLGTESCARLKREWAVRLRTLPLTGSTFTISLPSPGDADYLTGHGYSALAAVVNKTNTNIVNSDDIVDLRQTRLTLADLVRRVSLLERVTLLPSFDPPPQPQFTPSAGPAGTTSVTLHGRNLTIGSPQVLFGNVPATTVGTSLNPRGLELFALVPQGVTGNVNITIITEGGKVVSHDIFTVLPPPSFAQPPQEFTPTDMVSNAPVQVTLNGNNFDGPNPVVGFNLLDNSGNITGTFNVGIFSVTPTQIVTVAISNVTTIGSYRITVKTDGGSALSNGIFLVRNKEKETKEAAKDTKDTKDRKDATKEKEASKDNKDNKDNAKEKEGVKDRKDNAKEKEQGRLESMGVFGQEMVRGAVVELPPATGQAFIRPEERPEVGGQVLQQTDKEQGGGE